ncbi:hypothetical protein WKI71_01230 [Streptomyces sp. MS1.AVA.1]|uniref:Tetratricopeptide repeat protein n=1 Tax=Streptomyces machairae TaxID=3134109 RepID=A0ABU8UFK5_9ACTN
MQATANVHTGDFGTAMELISEEEAIADATGAAPLVYPRLHLAALRGRHKEAAELFASVDHRMSLSVQWATAVLHNGLADYPAALKAAKQAIEYGAVGTAWPCPARTGRGRHALRRHRCRRRGPRLPPTAHAGRPPRVGTRRRGLRARSGHRGRVRLPGGDRPARRQRTGRLPGPRTSAVRGVAAPSGPTA